MNDIIVYDKAKYHDETIFQNKLKPVQAEVHTAFFLGWIIDNDLCSNMFLENSNDYINGFKNRKTTALEIYEWWDCCLTSDMLNSQGNDFAKYYFNFEKVKFFTVKYNLANYLKIKEYIDKNYKEWSNKSDVQKYQFAKS